MKIPQALPVRLKKSVVEQAGRWTDDLDRAALQLHNAASPEDMLDAEVAVHEAMGQRADAVVATILRKRLESAAFLDRACAEVRERATAAGLRMHVRGKKPTVVRLLGGTELRLKTTLMLPATPSDPAKRGERGKRGQGGSGVYPALLKLGITDQATPALKAAVAREVVAAHSVKDARSSLEQRDLRVEHKTALRLTYALGMQALAARDRAIAGSTIGSELRGKHVVISLDGGRVRLRGPTDKETGKYKAPWREPKVLTIYVVRPDGKRDPAVRVLIDATMGDADDVTALLVGHLRLMGADQAEYVRLIADGGSWIWNRAESIRQAVGIPKERWSERLDYYHAVQYLTKVVEPISALGDKGRKTWLADVKARLFEGLASEVVACIKCLPAPEPEALRVLKDRIDPAAAAQFFTRHAERIGYMGSRLDETTIGSGAVESAVRRTVNLRMKGNSVYWLDEHAEPMLHMRACLVTERWQEMVRVAVCEAMWPIQEAA